MIALAAALAALAVGVAPLRRHAVGEVASTLLRRRRRAPAPVPVVEIASAMDLLALVLRSGSGVIEALETVGSRLDDAAGAHLRTVAAALRWGVPEREAWAAVPAAWEPAAYAFALAARAGAPPADLVERAADDMRRAERHRVESEAARLGVRVVLPLGLLFLPAFILTTVVPVVMALTGDVLGR